MNSIDYLYYKLALFFFSEDGEGGARAGIAISMLYLAVLWTFSVWLACYLYGGIWVDKYLKQLVISASAIWCIIVYANYRRYKNRFAYFDSKWQNEDRAISRMKTFASLLVYFSVLVLSIKITHDLPF